MVGSCSHITILLGIFPSIWHLRGNLDIPSFATALIKHPAPFHPFLPLLKASPNAEDPIPLLASAVLSSLLSRALTAASKNTDQIDEALSKLYSYLSSLSKSSDAGLQDI